MNSTKILIGFMLLFVLASCSDSWDCPANDDGSNTCKTITSADRNAYSMDVEDDDSTFSTPVSPAIVKLPSKDIKGNAKKKLQPYRSDELTARVYTYPFESKSGNLFEGGYVDMVLIAPRWVISNPKEKYQYEQSHKPQSKPVHTKITGE